MSETWLRLYESELLCDHRVEHPRRKESGQSPVLETLLNDCVACLRLCGAECHVDGLAQTLRGKALTSFGDDEFLEVLHRRPILGLLELAQIFFFALVVHRRVYEARFDHHEVDAKKHQFQPQHVRHSFKTRFGGAIRAEKRDSYFCTARSDVHDSPGGTLSLLIRPQERGEGLDYDKRGDHVDIQLPPVLAGPEI